MHSTQQGAPLRAGSRYVATLQKSCVRPPSFTQLAPNLTKTQRECRLGFSRQGSTPPTRGPQQRHVTVFLHPPFVPSSSLPRNLPSLFSWWPCPLLLPSPRRSPSPPATPFYASPEQALPPACSSFRTSCRSIWRRTRIVPKSSRLLGAPWESGLQRRASFRVGAGRLHSSGRQAVSTFTGYPLDGGVSCIRPGATVVVSDQILPSLAA